MASQVRGILNKSVFDTKLSGAAEMLEDAIQKDLSRLGKMG